MVRALALEMQFWGFNKETHALTGWHFVFLFPTCINIINNMAKLASAPDLVDVRPRSDLENQLTEAVLSVETLPVVKQKSLGAGVCIRFFISLHIHANKQSQTSLAIGAFATTLTTLSLSLMEWRGVTTTNVYIANFFFLSAFGLVVTAQWELAVGNGLAYSIFSAFGLFYAGYGALLTPSFGIAAAYGDDVQQYNNALGFFMICVY